MADPPSPHEPFDDAPGDAWVRPSQRRRGRPEPPADPQPEPDALDAATPDDRTVAGSRDRGPIHEPDVDGAGDAEGSGDEPDDLTVYAPPSSGSPDPDATVAAAAGTITADAARRTRRSHRRGRRRAAAAGVAALLVVAIVGALVLTSGGGSSKVVAKTRKVAAVTTTTTAPAAPALAVVATTKVPSLQVFDQPVTTGKVVTSLSAKTDYQQPRTLLVENDRTPGWLQVWLPMRPNDTQGWVRTTDVSTSTTDLAIKISLGAHHLWLTKAGQPVLDTGVAVGKGQTPTPTGIFYVTDPVDLQAHPNGAYGVFALGLSGYSNVLTSFEGGPGQIAIHGTPYAEQAGQDISNGCVRVPNLVMLEIAKTVPLGTPVTIVA